MMHSLHRFRHDVPSAVSASGTGQPRVARCRALKRRASEFPAAMISSFLAFILLSLTPRQSLHRRRNESLSLRHVVGTAVEAKSVAFTFTISSASLFRPSTKMSAATHYLTECSGTFIDGAFPPRDESSQHTSNNKSSMMSLTTSLIFCITLEKKISKPH